jgi:alcohol dehydrogenase
MEAFDFQAHTRLVFGSGALARLGALASESGFRRALLVADRGLVAAGYVEQAARHLSQEGIEVIPFHDFGLNPDTEMIERGCAAASPLKVDSIIGLGGGSSLDCAKGINFLLTNGGRMQDYWGFGKAQRRMLPMIGIPTTAGTGSEAQCYALISDAQTHVKMACGDPHRDSRSRPDPLAATRHHRDRGLRCHRARGRNLRHDEAQPLIRTLLS